MAGIAALASATSGCGGDDPAPRVLRVDGSIQTTVDEARSGDVVLIPKGTYHEAVTIDTYGVVLRGEDRTGVVLDGGNELVNGVTVSADDVVVENLTATGYTQNGVIFNGAIEHGKDDGTVAGDTGQALDGFAARYLTTYNNGLYGVYAFGARSGTIEHVYASGHPDSGIYVGQCKDCDIVVRDSIAEHNAIGILFTNASGASLIDSTARGNRLGIAINSEYAELLAPTTGALVAGNLVTDNDDPATPEIASGFFSGGIALGGAHATTVTRNRVTGHVDGQGIVLLRLGDFGAEANQVTDNVLADNASDLTLSGGTSGDGNCFGGNDAAVTTPPDLVAQLPCPSSSGGSIDADVAVHSDAPEGVDYQTLPAPPAQPNRPGRADAEATKLTAPTAPDPAAITVPT